MVSLKSTLSKANRRLPLSTAATLLAGSTLIASLLGLMRDRILNGLYYTTYPQGIDAYTAAFLIPDFMFFILVSGALSVSFIPVFSQRMADNNKKSAWELSTSMVNVMALGTLIASILIIIFADPLVRYVVGPGLDESSRALAISMMRVIAVNPFLFSIASVITSMQQAVGRFVFYAIAPAVYNFSIIFGALFFTNGINIFGWQVFEGGIMGVALGVAMGSVLQLLISCIGLWGMGFDYQFKIYWRNKGFLKVMSLLPARSINQGITYIEEIAETNLASRMAAGSIRAYQQASNLALVPVSLIGQAIGTAAFPKMADRLSQGRPDLFKKELQTILRVIIWLSLPVTVITFFGRGYIISFIKNGGDITMATALGVLAASIIFNSIYQIAARSFYARQNTRTPLYIALFAIALNIILAVWFTQSLNMQVFGLALATTIASIVQVIILLVIMSRQIPGLFSGRFIRAIIRMISATGLMAVVTYFSFNLLPLRATDQSFFSAFPKFVLVSSINLIIYVLICWMFDLKEAKPVIEWFKKVLFSGFKRSIG